MIAALVASALAQDVPYGFDAHGFRYVSAAADPRAPVRFLRPGDAAELGWSVGAVGEYANRPLVFDTGSDALGVQTSSANLAAVNVAAGFVPVAPVRIDLSMPVILANEYRTTPFYDALESTASGGPTTGDLRASVLGAVLTPEDTDLFGLGVVAALDLPTGTPERWLGTRGPAGLLGLAFTAELDALAFSGQLGGRLAPNVKPADYPAPTLGGDTIEVAGGASYLATASVGIGLEAQASIPVAAAVRDSLGIPAEATLSGRFVSASGGHVLAGLGVGLGQGAGASPFRLVIGGGFGTPAAGALHALPDGEPPRPKGRDLDGDGIGGVADLCPEQPEVANGVKDDDGCPDELPTVVFEAHLRSGEVDEIPSETVLVVTKADGTKQTGQTRVTVAGPPGAPLHVEASYGDCRGASLDAALPAEGRSDVRVDLGRVEGKVVITATDKAGRPLRNAVARYVITDEFCKPAESALVAGAGTHVLGTGPTKLFVTAPGYSTFPATFTLAAGEEHVVAAQLDPTLVKLESGAVKTSVPLTFGANGLDDRNAATVDQIASLLLVQDPKPTLEVRGYGDGGLLRANVVVEALVAAGYDGSLLKPVQAGAQPKDQRDQVLLVVLPTP